MLKLSPELQKVTDDLGVSNEEICFMTISKDNLDDMRSGIKNVEYRDNSAYWNEKFFIADRAGNVSLKKNYTHLLFQNGYNPDSPRVLIELKGIVTSKYKFPKNLSAAGHEIWNGSINLLLGKILYDSDPLNPQPSVKKAPVKKAEPKKMATSTSPKKKSKPIDEV